MNCPTFTEAVYDQQGWGGHELHAEAQAPQAPLQDLRLRRQRGQKHVPLLVQVQQALHVLHHVLLLHTRNYTAQQVLM